MVFRVDEPTPHWYYISLGCSMTADIGVEALPLAGDPATIEEYGIEFTLRYLKLKKERKEIEKER